MVSARFKSFINRISLITGAMSPIIRSLKEYFSNRLPISAAILTFCFASLLAYVLEVNALEGNAPNQINFNTEPNRWIAPLVVLFFGIIMGILLGMALWLNRTATLRAVEAEELAKRLSKEEVALKNSKENFQLITKTMKGVFFIISVDYQKIYYVSPEYEKWSGHDCQYLYDNSEAWESWIHPDDLAVIRSAVAGRKEGDFATKMPDYRVNNPDLPDRWVSSQTYPARNEKGEIIRYIGFISDITQRKQAEDTLKNSEERFRQIAETVNDVFFVLSSDHQQLIYLSPSFRKNYGSSFDGLCDEPEVIGDYLRHWVHPEDLKIITQAIERRRANNFEGITDYRIVRNDGAIRRISGHVNPVRDKKGNVTRIIGTLTDITDRRNLENKLRQAKKMEAVGQLTGGIAHDFNNILGIIMGNLEILKKTVPDNTKALKRVEKALNGVERGAKLTKKLLRFSRKKSYASELISVNQFIRNLKELIVKSLTVSITVKVVLSENLWSVDVDSGDLEDAILNIALNARDAMPDGGALLIETANQTLDEFYVSRNPDSKTGEFIIISISDTGGGMTQEIQDKILEPFFTTKASNKGTGLGLSMVHGFIKRSGGHIKIYSELGKGTTFRLYIPKSTTEPNRLNHDIDDQKALPRGNETILIVDDEVALCEAAKDQLNHLGYSVITANNAMEGLNILENNRNIDLLFSDIVMPGSVDGYELARETLKIYPGLKILLTSGFTQNREKYLNNGNKELSRLVQNILNKPYNMNELSHAVRRELDRKDTI